MDNITKFIECVAIATVTVYTCKGIIVFVCVCNMKPFYKGHPWADQQLIKRWPAKYQVQWRLLAQ